MAKYKLYEQCNYVETQHAQMWLMTIIMTNEVKELKHKVHSDILQQNHKGSLDDNNELQKEKESMAIALQGKKQKIYQIKIKSHRMIQLKGNK